MSELISDAIAVRRRPGRPPNAASTPAPISAEAETAPAGDNLRKARTPFGSHRQKLSYPAREGYHRHWFKDSLPGRIDDALAAGYEHVKDKQGRIVARVTGVSPGGGPETSYLMELPEELYRQDMAAQEAENDKLDNAIRHGSIEGQPGKDGRYIPTTGIKISRA